MRNISNYSSFNPLIVLDIANNHDGSLHHGKLIIDEISKVSKQFSFDTAVKFQYRNLDTFIHPDYIHRRDLKYVDRFLSSRLSWEHYRELRDYAKHKGLITSCTPFDEYAVTKVVEHEYDFLKIASVSLTDWSLLETIADKWNGPIVASTAGSIMTDIERVATFFSNRKKEFALMHCVAAYPTKDEDLLIARITTLKQKFPNIPIGYSTHEDPANTLAAPLALAAGAIILERHVGEISDGHKLNAYSSDHVALYNWYTSIADSIKMLGQTSRIDLTNPEEKKAIAGLRRYAFATRDLQPGIVLKPTDYFFAIPGIENQVTSNDIGKYDRFLVNRKIGKNQPITFDETTHTNLRSSVDFFRKQIKELLDKAGILIPQGLDLELSHHYGLENFAKTGCAMLTVVNREYCKKILVLLPGQSHPAMFHKLKDETFFLAYGSVNLRLDSQEISFEVGQTRNISPGVVHEFSSTGGAIIEEISTSHFGSDSFYLDDNINHNQDRKTFISFWN